MNLSLASYIDHTLLKQTATRKQILTLCEEAKQFHFKSVCIQPHYVQTAARYLQGSEVKVCTVIGFPLGQNITAVKVGETRRALRQGADEIDMVINLSWLMDGADVKIIKEIKAIKAACGDRILKVILETSLLTSDQIVHACTLCQEAGADFVKTSTGFANGGATVEAVTLMKKTVGSSLEVKASGGVRDLATMKAMIAAGATRIGTSSGVAIIQGDVSSSSY
jgi:deoxyribose-phosphate aldolase